LCVCVVLEEVNGRVKAARVKEEKMGGEGGRIFILFVAT